MKDIKQTIKWSSINQPTIKGKEVKHGQMRLGLPDSHLMLELDDVVIIMKVGRSQIATRDKMERALKTILQEKEIEELRKTKQYQDIINEKH